MLIYKDLELLQSVKMPTEGKWEGANRDLYNEIQDYVASEGAGKQFEIETKRFDPVAGMPPRDIEFWITRTR